MQQGEIILIQIVSYALSILIMFPMVKYLAKRMVDDLRETLLKLENNDVKLNEKIDKTALEQNSKISNNEKCIAVVKKSVENNEADIYELDNKFEKHRENHA